MTWNICILSTYNFLPMVDDRDRDGVELHVSMDLLSEALEHDTFGERAELPDPRSLSGGLLLADRGYFSLPYVGDMIKAGASFVLRTKTNLNPLVVNAYGKAGKRLRRWCGKPLRAVVLPENPYVAE